jgi:hypothetical protein
MFILYMIGLWSGVKTSVDILYGLELGLKYASVD